MTKKEYKKFEEIQNEIENLTFFLDWYRNSFVLKGIGYSERSSCEIKLPKELEKEIVSIIEKYLDSFFENNIYV